MITITKEISMDEFEAWSGGKETLDQIQSVGKMDELDDLASEMFPDGCTDTELNDWLWFDSDSIYESLGLTEDGEEPPEETTVTVELDVEEEHGEDGEDYVRDEIEEVLDSMFSNFTVVGFDFSEVSRKLSENERFNYDQVTFKVTNIDWDQN